MLTYPKVDELMHLYYCLAFQVEISDVVSYAEQWQYLGDEFEAQYRLAMAEMCHARALQYIRLAPYLPDMKVVIGDGPIVTLQRLNAEVVG